MVHGMYYGSFMQMKLPCRYLTENVKYEKCEMASLIKLKLSRLEISISFTAVHLICFQRLAYRRQRISSHLNPIDNFHQFF